MASHSTMSIGLGQHGIGDWTMLGKNFNDYTKANSDQSSLTYAILEDCLELAKKNGVDMKEYDNDNNGYPDLSVFHFPGDSQRVGGDMIGDFALTDENFSAVVIAENGKYGDYKTSVLIHELGHGVIGLADLYDYSSSSMPIFGWDIMGDGLWQGYCGLSSFSRWKSGWMDFKWIEQPGEYVVDQLNTIDSDKPKAYGVRIPGSDQEWILIEFRQKKGLDAFENGIPSEGLVTYLVDDKRPYEYGFNSLSKDHRTHGFRFLKCLKPGDVLTSETSPGTNPYVKTDRTTPNLAIRNVSKSAEGMIFTLTLERPKLPLVSAPDKVYCGKIVKGTSATIQVPFSNIGTGTLHVLIQSKSKAITLDRTSFIGNDETIGATVDTRGYATGKYTEYLIYVNKSSETSGNVVFEFEVAAIHGDLDKNDVVDDRDLEMFWKVYGTTGDSPLFNPDADFNSDGVIDFTDLLMLARNYKAN